MSGQKEKLPLGSLDNYTLGKVLGTGAFSTVLKATYVHNGTTVAMKTIKLEDLNEKYTTLCANEVKLLKTVTSSNVIRCFEAFVEDKCLYVSLEYADNYDLAAKIDKLRSFGKMFSERSIWYFFHQICNGVKVLHEKRILHRDLKPANVFMCVNGSVKLGDLGLSRLFSSFTNAAQTRVGTEYYMAPERNSKGGYHFKSDIWSLGCLLYEMCTLRSPFNGETNNAYALHKKIENGEILPFPSNLYSRQIMFFAFHCMNVSPHDRPDAETAHAAARKMFKRYEKHLTDYKNACKRKNAAA